MADDPKPTPKPPRKWYDVPELKGTKLGALVAELEELQRAAKDLGSRIEGVRALIAEIAPGHGALLAYNSRVEWVEASSKEGLDRTLLIQAGVTPDQIAAGTKKTPVKAHLVVGPMKESVER